MSTATLSFDQLPEAGEVMPGNYFVIEQINGTAKKLNYQNLIFGLDNVTFAATISAQSSSITSLSTNMISLSTQLYSDNAALQNLLTTTIQTTTAAFLNQLYPLNTVIYTTTNVNPGVYLYGTQWNQVAQGLFLAGAGSGVDVNGAGFTVSPGNAAGNFTAGEYFHTLIPNEIPPHTHDFSIQLNNTGSSTSYQNGPQQPPAYRLDSQTTYTTQVNNTTNNPHNNMPPFYGVFVWQRVG